MAAAMRMPWFHRGWDGRRARGRGGCAPAAPVRPVSDARLERVAADFAAVRAAAGTIVDWAPPYACSRRWWGNACCTRGPTKTDLGIADPLAGRLSALANPDQCEADARGVLGQMDHRTRSIAPLQGGRASDPGGVKTQVRCSQRHRSRRRCASLSTPARIAAVSSPCRTAPQAVFQTGERPVCAHGRQDARALPAPPPTSSDASARRHRTRQS
jgi:hypothetical protein